MSLAIQFGLTAAVIGAFAGKKIGWAIRAWPGHEEFHCDYLECPKCENGKRRGCYNAGSTQDKLYVLFSAIIAGLSVWYFGLTLKAAISWLFAVSALIVTIVDIRFFIIPDTLSITGCWTGLVFTGLSYFWVKLGHAQPSYFVPFKDSIIGFLIGGGFLWFLGQLAWLILKKEGMGGGDVKLLAAMGAWSGWQTVLGTIILASFLGSIAGISTILYQKLKYDKKYKPLSHMIPFGPYLCVAFMFIFYFSLEPLLKVLDAYQMWLMR